MPKGKKTSTARTTKRVTKVSATKSRKTARPPAQAKPYVHSDAQHPMRPDVGTQPLFKQKKPPTTFQHTPSIGLKPREDSSAPPNLEWDGQNVARETGEALIREILEADDLAKAKAAASKLKSMSQPFLNWVGKAERLSFDVPTLPLFVHERLSTKAIIETLKSHRKDKGVEMLDLFGDPQRPIADQVLKAYEHGPWTNRMILGDSLVVMNSLLQYEGLGGKVQMIYMDPPYGVKFGSNFQPFVRKRDVSHGDDDDMTREPEMVKAYRDTWEFGIHSYMTYMRDRLALSRELLSLSGSIFVQISDENLHKIRQLLDEVFGEENFVGLVSFQKTGSSSDELLGEMYDYIIWYARDIERVKFQRLFLERDEETGIERYDQVDPDGRAFQYVSLLSDGARSGSSGESFEFEGRIFTPRAGSHWSVSKAGLIRLAEFNRIACTGKSLRWKKYQDDFPCVPLTNNWRGVMIGKEKNYVVQTAMSVVRRCMLMTTTPGDLVLDPTCGSGTTAYVAEQWGRRWITIDVSRVPLSLARQRLLTATFPWHQLQDDSRGPGSGFVYSRKQNAKGEEIGGIVPHVTLKSLANGESPEQEIVVDRPEQASGITRVSGPFSVEAMIPTPIDWDGDGKDASGAMTSDSQKSYLDRMLEVLRKSPLLHLTGGNKVTLHNVRQPARTLSLSAEASVEATANGQAPTLAEAIDEADDKRRGSLPLTHKPVAIVFGPENGAMSERLIFEAVKEAEAKKYSHLYAIGFAIQPNARTLIENCAQVIGIPATYVQATPDLMMGDLLKNMRSSQIFSVCGLPEIKLRKVKSATKDGAPRYEVELIGLDVFDPVTMDVEHRRGDDVPAWFLDPNYNGLCFHVTQAFFPRTGAWDSLKKALKATHDESVWDHLAGAVSAPFEAGEHGQIAVKVIDDRGNELMVLEGIKNAK